MAGMSSRAARRLAAAAVTVLALIPALAAGAQPGNTAAADLCFGQEADFTGAIGATVIGTEYADVIIGGGRAEGLGGDDLICNVGYVLGGDGNDRIQLSNGGTANGMDGDDEIIALGEYGPPAQMLGGNGNDTIYGSPLGEIIYGGAGNDRIHSGGGGDRVYAGDGHDRVYGGPGRDVLFGGNGNDILDGGPGRDVSYGGLGSNRCRKSERVRQCQRLR